MLKKYLISEHREQEKYFSTLKDKLYPSNHVIFFLLRRILAIQLRELYTFYFKMSGLTELNCINLQSVVYCITSSHKCLTVHIKVLQSDWSKIIKSHVDKNDILTGRIVFLWTWDHLVYH